MKSDDYVDNFIKMLGTHFDIQRNVTLLNEHVELYAKINSTNMITLFPRDKFIRTLQENEYFIIKYVQNLDSASFHHFSDFIRACTCNLIHPDKEHRCSIINGILLYENIYDNNIVELVQTFKYSKVHRFYLYGWSEAHLILVDLNLKNIIADEDSKAIIGLCHCF